MNFIGEKGQCHFESHDSGDTCHDAETNPQLFVKTAGTFPQFDCICAETIPQHAMRTLFISSDGVIVKSKIICDYLEDCCIFAPEKL